MRIDISAMRAAGLSDTQILDVIEKADEARRDKAAAKKRAQRAKPVIVPETMGTSGDSRDIGDMVSPPPFPLSSPPTPPPIIPQSTTPSGVLCEREADFRSSIAALYAKHGHLPPGTGTAVVWLKQGRDPAICCAVIDDLLAKKGKVLPLSYFEGPIADAHAAPKAGAPPRAPPPRKAENGWATMFRKSNQLGEFAHDGDGDGEQDWTHPGVPAFAGR